MHVRPRRVLAIVLAVLAGSLATGVPAASADPVFIPWTSILPGLPLGYEPSSSDVCRSGDIACVDAVIAEMERRFTPLGRACDHDALFALTYLRTTEEYRRSAADGTFFEDTAFVNHQDAVFAQYYFDAFDTWHAGDAAGTPPAWRVAFRAADRRSVSGLGNILLGMAAHVNRDLPYVLAEIGLVRPDGTSRKGDHDKVNEFLNRVIQPLLVEAAARFDPTVDDLNIPWTSLDETLVMQLLVTWREGAWRNAERLVLAPTPTARAWVEADIEVSAALTSELLATATSYGPLDWLFGRRAARDSYCTSHHGL